MGRCCEAVKRYERLTAILEAVGRDGKLDVDEAAIRFGASVATIRRDLDHLAAQELLTRTHGGALPGGTALDLPLQFKAGRQAPEKQRIGRAVAALIQPGTVVGMNGGTTNTEVARALAVAAGPVTGSPDRRVAFTIVTNAVNIAYELTLRPLIKTVVTGGVARDRSFELTGPLGTAMLEQLMLDVTVLGVDALDPTVGATAHHEGEATINRLMASRARTVIVAADATKLGQRAFALIWPAARIDVLVTDTAADPALLAQFADRGTKVVTA